MPYYGETGRSLPLLPLTLRTILIPTKEEDHWETWVKKWTGEYRPFRLSNLQLGTVANNEAIVFESFIQIFGMVGTYFSELSDNSKNN